MPLIWQLRYSTQGCRLSCRPQQRTFGRFSIHGCQEGKKPANCILGFVQSSKVSKVDLDNFFFYRDLWCSTDDCHCISIGMIWPLQGDLLSLGLGCRSRITKYYCELGTRGCRIVCVTCFDNVLATVAESVSQSGFVHSLRKGAYMVKSGYSDARGFLALVIFLVTFSV
jgi:hypothetical protein